MQYIKSYDNQLFSIIYLQYVKNELKAEAQIDTLRHMEARAEEFTSLKTI